MSDSDVLYVYIFLIDHVKNIYKELNKVQALKDFTSFRSYLKPSSKCLIIVSTIMSPKFLPF